MNFINQSNIERVIRVAAGLVLLVLGWGNLVPGTVGEIFKWLGFVPLLTGIVGFCPIYWLFKFRTNKS